MKKVKKFIFTYHHHDEWWDVHIHATDLDDAKQRVAKLPHSKPVGELVCEIPTGLGLFARILSWARNVFVRCC